MINQNSEMPPTPLDRAAEGAKTRIYSVMKHTPPRPPLQQVHKLPPMGTIAHSKTPFTTTPCEQQTQQKSAQNIQNQN